MFRFKEFLIQEISSDAFDEGWKLSRQSRGRRAKFTGTHTKGDTKIDFAIGSKHLRSGKVPPINKRHYGMEVTSKSDSDETAKHVVDRMGQFMRHSKATGMSFTHEPTKLHDKVLKALSNRDDIWVKPNWDKT